MSGSRALEGYRPDVDGLRAVAVLSVIFFHLHKPLLPGGFLGVDVFFVISGYLITRNIIQSIEADRFSIGEFYRRRIKRIAPVMILVIAVTLVASQILLGPEDARDTAKSALYSLASLANVYFWKFGDTSYFALDNSQVPLLHLWSLGVEEQFYLLWPLLLSLAYRPNRAGKVFAAALAGAVVSFLLGELLYTRDPAFVYYMLPTRAGELLLGVLVAILVVRQGERRIASWLVSAAATVGTTVLIASLLLINEHMRFPGWNAVPPTAATALLIGTGHYRPTIWSRILATKGMVWIGLVSYSAYLWHWPLLALYRYGYGEPDIIASGAALLLTFLLAWLSYRYIEQPTRRSSRPLRQVFARQYVVPAGAVMALALLAVYAPRLGLSVHGKAYRQSLDASREAIRPAYAYPWVCQRQRVTTDDLRDPRCVLGGDSTTAPRVFLWGDSHAAQYVGMVAAFAESAGFRFRNAEVGSCPPLLEDPTAFVDSKRLADCLASLELLRPAALGSSVVIVSAAWQGYDGEPLFLAPFVETARELAAKGIRVIVLGNPPDFPSYQGLCPQRALTFPFVRCPRYMAPLSVYIANTNNTLRRFAERTPNVSYFDMNDYLCPGGLCAAFDASGEPRYFDRDHLSLPASSRLGRAIIERSGVPEPFNLIPGWLAQARTGPASLLPSQ